jgi:hypothetical protein
MLKESDFPTGEDGGLTHLDVCVDCVREVAG